MRGLFPSNGAFCPDPRIFPKGMSVVKCCGQRDIKGDRILSPSDSISIQSLRRCLCDR
eukprot:m.323844 g.323844  ORF g.323844 m.323844 type:complete len:58 (-) comp20362_c0_seq4:62-235(-)